MGGYKRREICSFITDRVRSTSSINFSSNFDQSTATSTFRTKINFGSKKYFDSKRIDFQSKAHFSYDKIRLFWRFVHSSSIEISINFSKEIQFRIKKIISIPEESTFNQKLFFRTIKFNYFGDYSISYIIYITAFLTLFTVLTVFALLTV